MNKWKHFTFLPTRILQNSAALSEYSFFQGKFDYLPKFNTSLFSLPQVTPGNFSYFTKALNEVSCWRERDMHIDPDMTRQVEGYQVDLMEPLGHIGLITLLTEFSGALPDE